MDDSRLLLHRSNRRDVAVAVLYFCELGSAPNRTLRLEVDDHCVYEVVDGNPHRRSRDLGFGDSSVVVVVVPHHRSHRLGAVLRLSVVLRLKEDMAGCLAGRLVLVHDLVLDLEGLGLVAWEVVRARNSRRLSGVVPFFLLALAFCALHPLHSRIRLSFLGSDGLLGDFCARDRVRWIPDKMLRRGIVELSLVLGCGSLRGVEQASKLRPSAGAADPPAALSRHDCRSSRWDRVGEVWTGDCRYVACAAGGRRRRGDAPWCMSE